LLQKYGDKQRNDIAKLSNTLSDCGYVLSGKSAARDGEMRRARADGKGIEDVGAGRRGKEKIERLREVKPKQRNGGEVIVGNERLRDIVFSTSVVIYTCEPGGDYATTFVTSHFITS